MSLFAKDEPARFAALRSFLDPVLSDTVCTDALKTARPGHGHDEGDVIAAAFGAAQGTPLRRMRVADIRTYLADCLMPKVDVASMAHALEVRAPLLDHEVVEFALSLPDEWVSDERTGKRILRAVLQRYLPGELFERPKQGFSVPLAIWFVRELRPLVDALPSSERLLDTTFFSGDGIRGIIAEHSAGFRDHSQRLYSLVVLDEWLKRL